MRRQAWLTCHALLFVSAHPAGEDFEHGAEGLSVRAGGFRFPCKGHPPHPLASDPVVIEDPINIMNNVARSCYRIQVRRGQHG